MVKDICIKSGRGGLNIGVGKPVRVNCNLGANSIEQYEYESQKIDVIINKGVLPDSFMDLSLIQFEKPLYSIIKDYGFPVGVVPAYFFPANCTITKHNGIDLLKQLADEGLSFFTLHLTASLPLFNRAKDIRKIPVTSRGGAIVLRQMLDTGCENIWLEILPDVIRIAKEYQITISLGSTFRPAGIEEACDEVHIKETKAQLKLCKKLQAEGVQVMVENVGHVALNKLEQHCKLLRKFNAPIMPLGPLPTDCAIGVDHIAAAIGASFMGYKDCAHIINCITRNEHSNSFFTIEETLEAIQTAKLTAHIIDVSKGNNLTEDNKVFSDRALLSCCLADKVESCVRCGPFCPLQLSKNIDKNSKI